MCVSVVLWCQCVGVFQIVKESGCGDDALREKFTRKLDEAKHDLAREKEVRIALEDSHQSLLSRVQDMEDAIDHERNLVRTTRF